MIQTISLAEGITLRCFYDSRFKQGCLSVQMIRPMVAEEAALNALLPAVLLRGTAQRPDLRAITHHLDDLYGASSDALVLRIGDYHTTGLHCTMMDDRFALPGDKVLEPMVDFVGELLLDPVLEHGVFREDYVQSEKRNLISAIESDINNKRVYAAKQLINSMCRGDSLGVPRLGEVAWVEAITPESLYAHYKKILRESPMEIFYVGSAPAWQVAGMLKSLVDRLERDYHPMPPQSGFHDVGGEDLVEQMEVTQAKLCMGYTTPISMADPQFPALQVMNVIFGSGMTSKLFMNVREKLSLCYSIGTGLYGAKGIITLSAGIDAAKEQQVREEIAVQLQALCDGDITDEEMAAAKEASFSGLRCVHDSPGAISNYYFSSLLSGLNLTPMDQMERIAAVTKEQVAAAAQTLKLHTTYILKGDDHENH